MRKTSGYYVRKHVTKETENWWKTAETIYEEFPQTVPDSLSPLLEKSLGETEIFVSIAELREIQAWAIGMNGWRTDHPYCPMIFSKTGI